MLCEARNFSIHKIFCALLFIAFFTCALSPARRAEAGKDALLEALKDYLVCFRLELVALEKQELSVSSKIFCLTEVYPEDDVRPFWVTPTGPNKRAHIVLDFLKKAEQEGLDPANYEVDDITRLFALRDPASLAMLDAILTFNLIKYIHDVRSGQVQQRYDGTILLPDAENIKFNPRATMQTVVAATDLAAYLESLPPQHRHYQGLKKALAQYRNIEQQGGWLPIPAGPTLKPGDNDSRVPFLMRRLYVTGDLDLTMPLEPLTSTYGASLKQGVMNFQQRHGLGADGIIGSDTFAALNVSVKERIRQIKINMTRWRWQEHDLGESYLLINIAHFDLSAFDQGHYKLGMRVIVGETQNQTPVFSDRLDYIVINPYWIVPRSIARDEELPKLRKNPGTLSKRHIRLFSGWSEDDVELDPATINWNAVTWTRMGDYKLRQDPGPWNALGRIKFVFPNKYRVYLHDTPAHRLFDRQQRDFSHGCIRVSEPLKLAVFVLNGRTGEDWPEEKIIKHIDEKERLVIKLTKQLPVHITYQTAWFDKHGIVCFNYDVYGRDEKLLNAMFED